MADFLLELHSEEIPARMQEGAARRLDERFRALLAEGGLAADEVGTFVTPRRLALLARGLPRQSAALREERRGPRADAPAKAVEGFLRSTGLARDQLEERDTEKGVFLFASLARAGRAAADILAERLPALVAGFDWPKSQRWGTASVSTASPRWVRPLRAIVALLDDEVVAFEALGLRSGHKTFGHRFMSSAEPMTIDRPGSYRNQLQASFVLLSGEERRQIIRERAAAVASAAGLVLRADAALEAENAGLTEWPVPLLGRFDPAYLDVPNEIIQLTMATNQKYFAVEDAAGRLAPAFVCVANLEAADKGAAIIAGNERVLSARLADARFFFEQDRKTPLAEFAKKLSGIVFHEKLGTMADKVERVAKLARWLVEKDIVRNPSPGELSRAEFADLVERAARLAKADLTTGTVGEFPELQGIIGGYLAEHQGESPHVVSALKQQYVQIPQGSVAIVLALADRLDTLCEFFFIDEAPTGSRDPFALRRAALGIISIILENDLRFRLEDFVLAACRGDLKKFERVFFGELEKGLANFFADRLKVRQRDAGVRHDLIDAALRYRNEDGRERLDDDLVRLLMRERALQGFIDSKDGSNLLTGYRRAANILRAEEKRDGKAYAFDPAANATGMEEAERALLTALLTVSADVAALVAAEDFAGAMRRLAAFRAPVDRFFDEVTVNDADAAKRARRLGLLAGLRDAMHKVADFSKIEG